MKVIIDHILNIINPGWDGVVDQVPEHFIRIRSLDRSAKPSIGMLNRAYASYERKRYFPHLLTVDIALNPLNLTELGLPSDFELCRAYEFEKVIKTVFENSVPSHFLGHLICDGHFSIWWYVHDPRKSTSYLKHAKDSFDLNFEFNYQLDRNWEIVLQYIQTEFHTPILS